MGLIAFAGLAFSGGPLPQSPSKFQVSDPENSWLESVRAALTNQPSAAVSTAAEEPVFGNSFPKFQFHNLDIVWGAPTNQSRAALWIYKVVPRSFSGTIVSNLMALDSFTVQDEQRWQRKILSTNTEPLLFVNQSNTCTLLIVPSQGRIEYHDEYAPANHWDKAKHLHERVSGLPSDAAVEKLGLKFLKQFGIQRDDLAQKPNGHLITFGTIERRSYFDKARGKYIDDEAISRGIYFSRRIAGINFAGIGNGGGCEIVYGNHAKLAEFKLVWRNLQPYEHRQAASPEEIMQKIRDGNAVMTHKNLVNPATIQRLTITDCSLLYMGAAGNVSQDFVYPFAQLEAVARISGTNVNVQLYCPILSTHLIR